MSVDGAAEKSSLQKSRSELQLSHSLRQINFFDPCKAEKAPHIPRLPGISTWQDLTDLLYSIFMI